MKIIRRKSKDGIVIRHPIRFKIFLVCLAPTIALLAAAFVNNQYLSSLGESAELILSKNYKSIKAAQEVRKSLEEIQNNLLDHVSRGMRFPGVSADTLKKLSSNLSVCRENITEDGEQDLVNHLYELYSQYEIPVRSFGPTLDDPLSGQRVAGFLTLTAKMVLTVDSLVLINEKAMERAELETRDFASRAQRHSTILFGVIIGAILTLSYFLSYRIARPIMTLARSLSDTREGTGVYPIVETRTGDEIGFLTQSFSRLFNRLEQYDRHRDDILAEEKEKVRRSEEAKGRFIADISHQLKTPLTSLSMSIGMLHERGEGLEAEKKGKLLKMAHDDCRRLTVLINELVDISRLETMSKPRPKETLDIGVVIRESLAPLMKEAEIKGVFIEIHVQEKLPPVTIDSFRFPWVITNLVGNALRYTDRGGRIILRVHKQQSRFYFHCIDTGSGINPRFLPHIFDRFTQFSERGKSGTIGLGLAIVKDIIEQHGGDIHVRSTMGEGATFTFWIPSKAEDMNGKSADH